MSVLFVVAFLLSFFSRAIEGRAGDTDTQTSNLLNSSITFPSAFSMTVDAYDIFNGSKRGASVSLWMDRKELRIRMDTYGSILKTFIEKTGQEFYTYTVFPVTINNEDSCIGRTDKEDKTIYFENLEAYFETNFKYVGKELVRGIEADKWINETLQRNSRLITVYLRPQKSAKDSSKQLLTPILAIVSIKSVVKNLEFTQRYEITSFSEEILPADIFNESLDKSRCIEKEAMDQIYSNLKENFVEVHEDEFSGSSDKLAENFDWRELGAVNEIKGIYQCVREMSWSCAVAAVVESAYFLHTNRTNLLRLSKQALMDCSVAYKLGIDMKPRAGENFAYEWIIFNKGIPEEAHYPGPNTGIHESCKIRNITKPMTAAIKRWGRVPAKNKNSLKTALVRLGPLAVHIQADISSLMKHSDEIYNDPTCGDKDFILPYSGLLVGFGMENNAEYWIVNVFRGTSIGQEGYLKIAIENNICGVMDEATFVTF